MRVLALILVLCLVPAAAAWAQPTVPQARHAIRHLWHHLGYRPTITHCRRHPHSVSCNVTVHVPVHVDGESFIETQLYPEVVRRRHGRLVVEWEGGA